MSDDLQEYWDCLHNPGPEAPPEPGKHPGDLVIGTSKGRILVRIHPDGTLTYGPEYTPDEAAVEFWTQMAIRRLESEERIIHLGVMEQILQQIGRADLAHEGAQARARREGATEHDRFMGEMSRRSLEVAVHQAIEFGRGLAARPNPPPPVDQLIRPDRPVLRDIIDEDIGTSSETQEMPAPVHQFCLSCEQSPWDDPEPHCACGAPWEDDHCSQSMV